MSSSFIKRALILFAAAAVLPAVQAQNPAPKSPLAAILEAMRQENVQDISYFDENKVAITREQFEQQLAAGKVFRATKSASKGEAPSASLTLTSKEALEALRSPVFKVKAGEPFPAFSLRQLDGTVVDNAALHSRYTLINFMFADCAPCVKEVPELNAFAKAHAEMNFVAMTFDKDAEAKKFAETHKFDWKMLSDAQKTISAAGVKGFPSFALLDPQGAVVAIAVHTQFAGKGVAGWVERFLPSPAAAPIQAPGPAPESPPAVHRDGS